MPPISPSGAFLRQTFFPAVTSSCSLPARTARSPGRLFFAHPMPGWANDVNSVGFADNPRFSIAGGVYTNNSLSLALSVSSPTAVIHYTLNATEPTEASPLYSAPIVTNASTVVRAKVFDPGLQPSATVSQNYTLLGSDVVNFNSNLPLVIINTFGRSVPDGVKIPSNARFIDTFGGRA